MAEAENVSSQWEDPEESATLTEKERNLMSVCRSECDETMMTHVECIKFARKFRTDKTEKQMRASLELWKKNHRVLRVDPNKLFENEEQLQKWNPVYAYGQDIQGHLVVYVLAETIDLSALAKNMDAMIEYYFRMAARLTVWNAEQSKLREKLIYTMSWVIDCKKVGWGTILYYLNTFRKLMKKIRSTVPSLISRLYVFNPPKGTETILGIIAMHPTARAKLTFFYSSDYSSLDNFIHPSQRPEEWGGTATISKKIGDITVVKEDDVLEVRE